MESHIDDGLVRAVYGNGSLGRLVASVTRASDARKCREDFFVVGLYKTLESFCIARLKYFACTPQTFSANPGFSSATNDPHGAAQNCH